MREKACGWTGWSVALLALATASCERNYSVQDIRCGPVKLRLRQTRNWSPNSTWWSESIMLSRPSGWVSLDTIPHRLNGPDTFSRVLPPEVAFRSFPVAAASPGGPGWTVYVDPAVVSRAEYDAVASCLASNAATIERAFAAGPMRGAQVGTRPGANMRVTATLYTRYEEEFISCGDQTLGTRWDCADGKAYIKTVVNQERGQLVLCQFDAPGRPGRDVSSGMMTLGKLSTDQKTVFLQAPSSHDFMTVLHANEPQAYYGTCRDGSGKGFYDTFSVAPDGSSGGGAVGDAHAFFKAGQYEQALAGYREALRQEPNAIVYYQAGLCLDKLVRKKEALEAYRKAVELAPDNADFHYQVATHLFERKMYKEAIEHYRRITALEPTVPKIFTCSGERSDHPLSTVT